MTNTLPVSLFENLVPHRDWGLAGEFGANRPKMVFALGQNLATPCQIYTKKPSFYSEFNVKKTRLFLLKI